MANRRLSKSALAALLPGQVVEYQDFHLETGQVELRSGRVLQVPLPREHPLQLEGYGSEFFAVEVGEGAEPPVLVMGNEIVRILTPGDPLLVEARRAWLLGRRPKSLQAQRARLAAEVAELWAASGSARADEVVRALPYRSENGPALKLIADRNKRVGEYPLPDGPLRMRSESHRESALRTLQAEGFAVELVDMPASYAVADFVRRSRGFWTLHPVIDGELRTALELGAYWPQDQSFVSRFPELTPLMTNLMSRQGYSVASTRHEVENIFEPLPEGIVGPERQRALADGDIAGLLRILKRESSEAWPPAIGQSKRTTPRRALTPKARSVLTQLAADTLEAHWRPTGWWWNVGLNGEWECALTQPRFAVGAWSHAAQDLVASIQVTLELPEGTEAIFSQWADLTPWHAPSVTALELRRHFPGWWAALKEEVPSEQIQPVLDEVRRKAAQLPHGERRVDEGPWTVDGKLTVYVAFGISTAMSHAWAPQRPLEPRDCAICATPFGLHSLSSLDLQTFPAADLCPICVEDARSGLLHDVGLELPWQDTAVWALRQAVKEFAGPPALAQLEAPLSRHASDSVSPALTRMLIPRLGPPVHAPVRKQHSWTEWLLLAGVLEGFRTSRGTSAVATDGHLCRSLFERQVDDFFFRCGITHEPEPHYPYDPELNTAGLRADWRLDDGTFVEAAGLLGQKDYEAKMNRKKALAAAAGVELLIVRPKDLTRLDILFAPWIAQTATSQARREPPPDQVLGGIDWWPTSM